MNTNSLWLPTDAATKLYADTRKFEQAATKAKFAGESNPDLEIPDCINSAWLQRLYNSMLFSIAPIGPPADCDVRIADLRYEDRPEQFQQALDIETKSGDPKILRLMKAWGKAINEEVNRTSDCPKQMSIQELHALIWSRQLNGRIRINLRGEGTDFDDNEVFFSISDLENSGIITAMENNMRYRDRNESQNFTDFLYAKESQGLITARELLNFYDEYCHIRRES
jgi:hypothetical protein